MSRRIAFLSVEDPRSPDAFSGSTAQLLRALEGAGATVACLGPAPDGLVRAKPWRKIYWRLRGYRYQFRHAPAYRRALGEFFTARLRGGNFDCVLSRGTEPVGELQTGLPIFLWQDATFRLLQGGYHEFTHLPPEQERACSAWEGRALRAARGAIFTSYWAADSAVRDYQVDHERAHVVPIGANRGCSWNEARIKAQIAAKRFDEIKLLFVGTEPFRKGADRALVFVRWLREAGLNVSATLVGFTPARRRQLPYVRVQERLPHSDPRSISMMEHLFSESHFLLLPSRADCSPVVVAEAASYGLPVIASEAGGLPEMVSDDVTGLVSPFAVMEDYDRLAARVRAIVAKPARWRALAIESRVRFVAELNWPMHARRVREIIEHST